MSMITQDPPITPALVQKHGLTAEEYEKIQGILGREPNYTELGIFSVMWSEHCSYKNTRPLLKGFPTKSEKILVGAGEENAGIIDIGDGLAIAFKIESHNHPSAVEPFQGAATGMGWRSRSRWRRTPPRGGWRRPTVRRPGWGGSSGTFSRWGRGRCAR